MTDDELKSLFDALRQENAAAHTETRRDLNETADRLSAENRQYFEVATEATRHAIGLIAGRVRGIDERLTREGADIREEMRHGFADTQR